MAIAMITQLNPPLPLHTAKGPGLAHFVIDYGPEYDLVWVMFMDADGACWSVPNPEVKMQFNWTLGRRPAPKMAAAPAAAAPLAPALPDEVRPAAAGAAGADNVRVFPRGSEG
ncbi:MAG: hypothetical protein Q7T81_04445 [Pseudolabrys sp.]|nr:hypothetical protein [Pseudolabrys sp.]